MNAFLNFLAKNPIGSALKVAAGLALAEGLSNIQALHLPQAAALVVTVLVPPIINWLNPNDPRYGNGSSN